MFNIQSSTFKLHVFNFTHSIKSIIPLFGFNFKSVHLVHYVQTQLYSAFLSIFNMRFNFIRGGGGGPLCPLGNKKKRIFVVYLVCNRLRLLHCLHSSFPFDVQLRNSSIETCKPVKRKSQFDCVSLLSRSHAKNLFLQMHFRIYQTSFLSLDDDSTFALDSSTNLQYKTKYKKT